MSHEIVSETRRRLPEQTLSLTLLGTDGSRHPVSLQVQKLIIAGWAGRDAQSLEAHIRELELLGVPRPKKTPEFYHLSSSLLTPAQQIQVIGNGSSGEVECVFFTSQGKLRVGLGSDHTDRKAEVFGIALSKQLCPKPIASEVWAYEDVASHWDELVLRSYAVSGEERTLYQEDTVALLMHPLVLLNLYREEWGAEIGDGVAMFCGTIPSHGGVGWAESFHIELYDPVLNRRLTHQYDVSPLPLADPIG